MQDAKDSNCFALYVVEENVVLVDHEFTGAFNPPGTADLWELR